MQVSKMEKFGYGFMLSQIAATAPGIRAVLDKTGAKITSISVSLEGMEFIQSILIINVLFRLRQKVMCKALERDRVCRRFVHIQAKTMANNPDFKICIKGLERL